MADGRSAVIQVLVPQKLREEVLTDLHEGPLGGHLGVDKTLARVQERFYWPGYHDDIQNRCRCCAACATRKNPTPTSRAPLTSVKTGYPLQLVAIDILGPFPESEAGNSYILVVADYFTRWTEAYPIPNQEATTVAKKLTDEFFFWFSPPEQLHSDQGRNFESAVIADICKLLAMRKSRTTPYHPQSNGLVERCNRTLLSMLAGYCCHGATIPVGGPLETVMYGLQQQHSSHHWIHSILFDVHNVWAASQDAH